MTINELKRYINDNDKIPFILESLSCHHIKEWPNRISAANPDGDNTGAIQVYRSESLNTTDYTRDLSKISDNADLITLVQYIRNCDFRDAFVWLHQILGIKLTYSTQKVETENPLNIFKSLNRHKKVIIDDVIYDENLLDDYYDYPHIDFVIDAELTKPTIKKFNIGYSYSAKRTILPVRLWSSGELIGVRGRTSIPNPDVLGVPKYYPLTPFPTGHHLYGLWENYEQIKKSKRVVVFEGEKSVLKADSLQKFIQYLAGDTLYGVSLFGHELSDEQCTILSSMNLDEIIIALDKDMPEETSWKICEKFYPYRNVSYIYDKYGILGDHDSPIDNSIHDFVKLYNNRITYDEQCHLNYINPQP